VQTLQLKAHPASLPKALYPTQYVIQKPAPCKQTRPDRNSDHVNQKPSASRDSTPPVPRTNHLKCTLTSKNYMLPAGLSSNQFKIKPHQIKKNNPFLKNIFLN